MAALLAETVRRGGTDLLLVPGSPPVLRLHGALEPVASGAEPFGATEAFDLLSPSLSAERRRRYAAEGAVDLSLRAGDLGRFRVNLHRTRRGAAAAVRVLPKRIPPLAELGLPESLYDLTKGTRGLVLVTGATGSGKTTTLAALVDRINRTSRRHVVTIEDPVEYEHAHGTSVVEQVEVGADAPSFAAALVAALRQDPDVILVGEMRDLETTRAALTAAETGHLVLATLHTNDVPQTVNRITDIFPAEQQATVRQQLSLALSAVLCQQLVPRADGKGRVVATELMIATDGVRAHIRKGSFHQLHTELTLGRRFGMSTMEDSLARLVKAGTVTEAEARLRSAHPDDLAALLR
ncbi:MAG: PilT/PilU family type 4a pilus ATPase [Thermoanaerobaculia bacterium]|nr:PilT/PilU family type 4a pilus ATPase [Thermoanaerobaculia bacterium]